MKIIPEKCGDEEREIVIGVRADDDGVRIVGRINNETYYICSISEEGLKRYSSYTPGIKTDGGGKIAIIN